MGIPINLAQFLSGKKLKTNFELHRMEIGREFPEWMPCVVPLHAG
jgi:hypothetical protein